ncbi:hypothetical protein JW906_12670 [bacterium]|nr:hypothetical protein [bacterium]
MRQIVISAVCILFAVNLFGQEETLISDHFDSGFFGGPVWKGTLMNGKAGLLSGGRGGWIINHTFVIGGGGYDSMWDVRTDRTSVNGKTLYLGMEYGGLELEYIHRSARMIHYTVYALFGSGKIRLREHDPNRDSENDGFLVADAAVNAEINIAGWFRLGIGGGYRLVYGIEAEGLDNGDIGGPSACLTLKFGKF